MNNEINEKSQENSLKREAYQIFPNLKFPQTYCMQESIDLLVDVLEKKHHYINERAKEKREAEYLASVLSSDINSNSMELIKGNIVMYVLGYIDERSAVNWCEKNDVCVFKIGSGWCVNKLNFILAVNKPFINYLKSKHNDWKTHFIAYWENNVELIIGKSTSLDTPSRQRKYKPSTKEEKNVLSILNNL